MASNRIKGITIEIDGNTTKLQDSLKGVNSSLKDTQAQLRDVDKLLKLDPHNIELLTQKQELLGRQTENVAEKLKTLKDAQQQMIANGVDKMSDEYMALEREIIDCENEQEKLTEQIKKTESALSDMTQKGEKLKTIGNNIEDVGKKFLPVTEAVVGLGAAAVKITADFDSGMSQVAAISGATGEELEMLRDKAREMGAKTKFSATEAAEAFNYMAMAGWNAEEMMEGIEGIMNLAAASGEELGTTSDIVTDALTAFGYSAKDAGHFADVLAAAATNSNTNVAMMGASFKYVAPLCGSLGYSAEDAAVALGSMANAGIKADMAGTSLRNVLQRLAKPTKESEMAMETLGVSLYDDTGRMYSLMEVMQQLRVGIGDVKIPIDEFNEACEELDSQLESGTITQKEYDKQLDALTQRAFGAEKAEQARAMAMLGGARALSGLLAIANASEEDFNSLTDAIYNSEGAAEEMANIMLDNLNGQLTILKSQLQELAISFGELLMPKVEKLVGWLQKLMDWLNSMDDGTRNTVVNIALVAAAIGPVLIAVGKLIVFIGTIMTIIPMIAPVLSGIGGALATVAGVISGPVLLAIGAVIAAIAIWVKNWDEIKAGFQAFGEIVANAWTRACNQVEIGINKIRVWFAELKESLSQTWENIKTDLGKALDAAKAKWDEFKQKFDDWKNKIKSGWNDIKNMLKQPLPKPNIKLPHIKVTGSWSWNPPKAPSFGIEWYKKAMDDAYIMNGATIFGAQGGNLLGGGEAGSETIVGTDKLISMMSEAVGNQNITVVLQGDAAQVFSLVRAENQRFFKANGYSPLVV